MKNLKVATKLIVSFLIVAFLAAIVGAVGIYGLTTLDALNTELYKSNVVAISAMANFREAYQTERTQLRQILLNIGNPQAVENAIKVFSETEATIQLAMKNYEGTIENDADETAYYTAKDAYNGDYSTAKQNIFKAAREGDFETAQRLLVEAGPLVEPLVGGLRDSAKFNDDLAVSAMTETTSIATMITGMQIGMLLFAIIIALFFAFYISKLISRPLILLTHFMKRAGTTGDITLGEDDKKNIAEYALIRDEIGQCISSTGAFIVHLTEISDQLETIAAGDLTAEVNMLSPKDVIGVSLNSMIENLNGMFSEIRLAAEQVSSGAGQVSQGAQGLASGSSEQAASVQELSASLSELQDRTNHNAEDSSKAREANNTTAARLEDSIISMNQMLEAMRTIDESSSRITKVIKVIDDIAFQTNILALNAAVEAARAGQHGKGFAVVADEVRNLAAKSAEAAKETSALIEGSSARVKEGNEIVAKTNSDLEAAVESARESTRLIEQVTTASIGQANSITEISHGMDQISTVVQANSATAQESAATAQEMSAQAIVMNEVVSRFQLKKGEMSNVRAISQKSSYKAHDDSHLGQSNQSSGFPVGSKY